MADKSDDEKRFEEAMRFRHNLTPETDRGCALMACAYLDDRLKALLTKVFVEDTKVVGDLLDNSRPLGTFSSRIDTAYALGLLTKNQRWALHLIRNIRNSFGHQAEPLAFEDEPIASQCRELEKMNFMKRGMYRAMFCGAVMLVLAAIDHELGIASHAKPQKEPGLPIEIGMSEETAAIKDTIDRIFKAISPDFEPPVDR